MHFFRRKNRTDGTWMVAGENDIAKQYEQKILTYLESVHPEWVTFEMLCAQTMIAPDAMLHVLLVVLQDMRIEFDNDGPLTDVRVRYA